MKKHIKMDKYKLLNPSIDDIRNAVLKSSKSPYSKLAFSIVVTCEKSHPFKPLSIEEMKKIIGGNEKDHRLYLNKFCDKIEPEQVGRPPKPKKAGRPSFKSASNNSPSIVALNTKMLYHPSQEKIMKFQKDLGAYVCAELEITETQFQRRCRLIVKRCADELISRYAVKRCEDELIISSSSPLYDLMRYTALEMFKNELVKPYLSSLLPLPRS